MGVRILTDPSGNVTVLKGKPKPPPVIAKAAPVLTLRKKRLRQLSKVLGKIEEEIGLEKVWSDAAREAALEARKQGGKAGEKAHQQLVNHYGQMSSRHERMQDSHSEKGERFSNKADETSGDKSDQAGKASDAHQAASAEHENALDASSHAEEALRGGNQKEIEAATRSSDKSSARAEAASGRAKGFGRVPSGY